MRVDDAGNGGDALPQFLGDRKVVGAVADGADVDLRRQPEVQDLRHDIGGLEIEGVLRERGRQHLAQLPDIIGGRLVAFLERHLDDAVVDADGRAVGEGQIVGAGRQADIVDDQLAVLFRNDLADLVLHRLENLLGGFDPGAGRRADVKLDLAAVDERKEVAADQRQHHPAEAEHQHGDHRNDDSPLQQHGQQFRIAVAQAFEAALERRRYPREQAPGRAVSPV